MATAMEQEILTVEISDYTHDPEGSPVLGVVVGDNGTAGGLRTDHANRTGNPITPMTPPESSLVRIQAAPEQGSTCVSEAPTSMVARSFH